MKIRAVKIDLFHAVRQTDGIQTWSSQFFFKISRTCLKLVY